MVQSDFAPANSGDSVYQGDPLIGSVTSGAYGHRVQENVADPNEKKPSDWVDTKQIDDPEDKKPADWDDIPKQIRDTGTHTHALTRYPTAHGSSLHMA